jgi:RNA polymerase sigma-70 factor, ECF subfamily
LPAPLVHRDDEDALVQRTLSGDREAFGRLVEAYQGVLFNLALRMVGDPEDARDVTQSAFVKAYSKLATFDRRNRFFSWLYRIGINESLNWRGRRRSREELDDGLESPDAGPDRAAELSEEERLMNRALMDLTPDYRQVVILRHFLDFSHREIGELLQLPEKTVKSRLHTGRERLGVALQKHGYRPSWSNESSTV